MKVPNALVAEMPDKVSLSRLQNEGSQLLMVGWEALVKSIKATE